MGLRFQMYSQINFTLRSGLQTRMYESFFGLEQAPFKITPDTRTFFGGGRREELLNALLYTIQRGEGIVKVVGEVGSGKTTLLRKLATTLNDSPVRLVYINSPNMPARDILMFICNELGIKYQNTEPKFQLVGRLQKRLLDNHTDGKQVVLLIDEAQAMPLDTLEEVRLLSNLETESDKLLQIVMFGQPELDAHLDSAEVRQIKDRIAFSLRLEPFEQRELQEYLNFRLRAAGYIGNDLFTAAIVRKIYRQTQGYPRRVNLLADKILLAAFSSGGREITAALVNKALGEHTVNKGVKLPYWSLGLILLLILLLMALQWASIDLKAIFMPQQAAIVMPVEAEPAGPASEPELLTSDNVWLSRNRQTLKWVLSSLDNGQHYTVQLMSVRYQDAQDFINSQVLATLNTQLHIYGYEKEKQQVAVVLLGIFSAPEMAQDMLQRLPADIVTRYRPYVRALSDVKTELQARAVDPMTHI